MLLWRITIPSDEPNRTIIATMPLSMAIQVASSSIHPKSGDYSSAQNSWRKKALNRDGKILRQKCVNHENVMDFVTRYNICLFKLEEVKVFWMYASRWPKKVPTTIFATDASGTNCTFLAQFANFRQKHKLTYYVLIAWVCCASAYVSIYFSHWWTLLLGSCLYWSDPFFH